MSLFKSFMLTVKRPVPTGGTGQYSDGRWIPGNLTVDNFTVKSSVQPAKEKDLQVLPEGLRTGSIYKIYPKTELKEVDQHINQEADIVEYNGNDYTVIYVGIHQNNLINHYKALIIRTKE